MRSKTKRQNYELVKQLINIGEGVNDRNNKNLLRLKYRQSIKAAQGGEYYVQTDENFVEQIKTISKSQQNMLVNLIGNIKKQSLSDKQCDQIDHYARLHYKANIVNKNTDNQFNDIQDKYRCECGCKRAKGQQLSLLASIKQMSILGSGVALLFIFKKTFSFILLSAVIIYGIFALVTNLMGNSSISNKECEDSYCQYRSKASSENKLDPQTFNFIQWWVGVGFCFVWIFILRLIKYFGNEQDKNIDQYLNSSSDYAVMLENLPYGQYEQNQLISYFDLLSQKAAKIYLKKAIESKSNQNTSQQSSQNNIKLTKSPFQNISTNKFNMKSVQIIYNMQFSRVIIQKLLNLSFQINSLYKKNKKQNQQPMIKCQNIEKYKNVKKQLCQTFQFLTDLRKKFLYDQNFRRQISTTVALVQFNNPKDKDLFLSYFGNERIGMLKQVQQKIKSFFTAESRTIMFRGNVLKIQRAPQPSDLIFRNCQKKFSMSRILLIYLLTFVIILLSFAVMTILIYIQDYMAIQYQKNSLNSNNTQDDSMITYLNIVISLALQVVNKILWSALFYILDMEYNHTMTQKIISQMNKVLFSTCINIIALPIISNYVIRNNVYGSKGLAGMVFDYQISILGVGLIVKLIDPSNFIKRILLNIRKIRNFIIRFICSKLVNINPSKGVAEINSLYEGGYFDIAQSYVYIMAATYQAAFFCQLQPSLLILVTLVVIVFYWVNKFKVLRTCKIPQITQKLIFDAALSQAALVPIVYGAGSIVLSYIQSHYNLKLQINYSPAVISMGLGLVGFFNPKDILNKAIYFFMNKVVKYQNKQFKKQAQTQSAQGMVDKNKFSMKDQIEQKEPQILNRIDNYFRQSNTLPLIGFQHVLSGGDFTKFPSSTLTQLQNYCQNFVQGDNQNHKINNQKDIIKQKLFNLYDLPIQQKMKKRQSGLNKDILMGSVNKGKRNSIDKNKQQVNNMTNSVNKSKQQQITINGLNYSKFKLPKIQNTNKEK